MSFDLDITLLAVSLALAVRFAVLTATLPLLSVGSVPPLWRVGLAACFAVSLAPGLVATMPAGAVDLSWRPLVLEVLRSLVIGLLLGFTVNLVFTAVRYAGAIVGMQIGFAIVNSFDPMSNSQVSVIAQLYYLLTVIFFFATGAHHLLVASIFQSCQAVPPFTTMDPAGGAWFLMQEFGTVFSLGLKMSAPVVLVLLLVSASMGVIVKTVPQINVLVVGFPIQIAVGLITLGLSLLFFKEVVLVMLQNLEGQLDKVLLAIT